MSILSRLSHLEALIIGYYDPIDFKVYWNEKIDIALAGLWNLKTLHLGYFSYNNKNVNTDISVESSPNINI